MPAAGSTVSGRDDQVGNTADPRHAERRASLQIFAGRKAADKLPCRRGPDLHQHKSCSVLGFDADFAPFIVTPRQRQIVGRPEQARYQEVVGNSAGDRASLELRVGKPGGDRDPMAARRPAAMSSSLVTSRILPSAGASQNKPGILR